MTAQRFSAIPYDAVFDPRLSATDIRVLAALGAMCRKNGWGKPKQQTIADRLGISRSSVNVSIKLLADCGWLHKIDRIGRRGGKASCQYQIRFDVSPDDIDDVSPDDIDDVSPDDIDDVVQANTRCRPGTTSTIMRGLISESSLSLRSREARAHASGEASDSVSTSAKSKKRRAALDPKSALNKAGFAFASEHGFSDADAITMFEQFRDHHLKQGNVMADWAAAWRTWVRNEVKFNGKRNGGRPSQAENPHAVSQRAAAKVLARRYGAKPEALAEPDDVAALGPGAASR